MNIFLKILGGVALALIVSATGFGLWFYFTFCGHTHGVIC